MSEIISRAAAQALGLKRYFTDKPCKRGHVDERFVSNGVCRTCGMLDDTARYALNREKGCARTAAYRVANPEKGAAWRAVNREKAIAKAAAWRSANQEKALAYSVAYRAANQDSERARHAAYRAANREKACASSAVWRTANPEKALALARNHRARKIAAEGYHTVADIQRILRAQKCKCAMCKKSVKRARHVDHITSLSKGGSNWPCNLQILCPTCNQRKSAKCPIEFAREQGMLL